MVVMANAGMPEHIQRHSIMVERAAGLIAEAWIQSGADLSEDRIRSGALLHDIAKAPCFATGEDHAARGRDMCLEMGFHEIAEIVGQHVRLRDFEPHGDVLEKEVVFYADKRVNHDAIVSLEKRLADLIDRYGQGLDERIARIRKNFDVCRKVERKLFSGLDFRPEDLAGLIDGD